MLNVLELEKKWSKYHLKKILPLYIASFILVIIAGASSYLYLMQPKTVSALIKEEKAPEKADDAVVEETATDVENKASAEKEPSSKKGESS